jgi:hypothetical protein
MGEAVREKLTPVSRRQRFVRAAIFAAWGLLIAGAVVLLAALASWLQLGQFTLLQMLVVALAAPVAAYVVGLLWKQPLHRAAIAVDRHYQLKDRAATALEFVAKQDQTPAHALAIRDTVAHLERVQPREVAPFRMPKVLPYSLVLTAAAFVALYLAAPAEKTQAAPVGPLAVVVAQADRVAEELKELEQFAKEEENKELEKLVEEMKQAAEEMKEPGVDIREALAKLSEMQAALQAEQTKQQAGETEANLKAVGEALALAEPLAEAGKALANGEHDKAAEKLEKAEMPELDRQTEKAMKEKLEMIAKKMEEGPNGELSDAAAKMAQGVGSQDGSKFKEGASKLAGEAKKAGKRKKLSDLLKKQCNCLSECKGECECEGSNPSLANGKGGKKWGLGKSENEPGDKTVNLGAKQEKHLTGKHSNEGEVEVETTTSPEGKQDAQREYRQNFEKYKKMSDSVLESEPIPLGHRQTIRKYFESIRPSGEETDKTISGGEPETKP